MAIAYTLSIVNPAQRLLSVKCSFEISEPQQQIEIIIPYWRPGRYEKQHYARNILKMRAFGPNGNKIPIQKHMENAWLVQSDVAGTVTLHYQYYCNRADAGGCYLTEDLLYVNPVNCLVVPSNRLREKVQLTLELPDDFVVGCGLADVGSTKYYEAENIRRLYDSPLLAGRYLQHTIATFANIYQLHIWSYGLPFPWPKRWTSDFSKFAETQSALFQAPPFRSYHFLLLFTNIPFYHGVEHQNSTVIVHTVPSHPNDIENYHSLLGISSHEFFHAWNICTIKPKELVEWNITGPCYFKTGYVAEGFTTYYGDLMLLRSGIWDMETFLQAFGENYIRHMENPARNEVSLTESSMDLWTDGYQSTHPYRKVSIYDKGALVAFILDIYLRAHSNHQYSLDALMCYLWQRAQTKDYQGYSHQEIIDWVNDTHVLDGTNFSKKYIEGTTPLEQTLARALDYIGVIIEYSANPSVWERKLGLKVTPEAGGLRIRQIAAGSPAEKQLNKDDLIVEILNRPALDVWEQIPHEATMVYMKIETPFGLRSLALVCGEDGFFPKKYLKQQKQLTDEQRAFRARWMQTKI